MALSHYICKDPVVSIMLKGFSIICPVSVVDYLYQPCKINKARAFKILGVSAVFVSLFLNWQSFLWAGEPEDLQAVIKDYFQAEMSRNSDRIWNLLAPSSIIKRFYSYENYLESARLNPVRIIGYELKFPPEIIENQDRQNLPNVSKVASVVVKERLQDESGKESEKIVVLIFLLENGHWYKA
jgi:hypothetical protein